MNFKDIPGQVETKNRLVESVKKNKVAHALLFDGKAGSATLAMALAFAKYVNCSNPESLDSCGACSNCIKIEKLAHPDLSFTFPTAGGKKVLSDNFINDWRTFVKEKPFGDYSDWLNQIDIKQGNIPVEESRQIIQRLSLKSYEGGYKIVFIWNIEYMAAPAANALLKILEEPPEKTLFLIISSDYNRLLPTIQSRVQRVAIPELSNQELEEFLIDKHHVNSERAQQISFLVDGNINEALKLLKEKTNDHKTWFANWMRSCYAFDISKIVPITEEFDGFSKEEQKAVLEYGLKILREIYLENVGLNDLIKLEGEELTFVKKFSVVFEFKNIDKITEEISKAIFEIERNVRAKIVLLDLSITMATLIRKVK